MPPQSGPLELANADARAPYIPAAEAFSDAASLVASATQLARNLAWVPGQQESRQFPDRCDALNRTLLPFLTTLRTRSADKGALSDLDKLQKNNFLLSGELLETCKTFQTSHKLPQVRTPGGAIIPRIAAVAGDYLAATHYGFSEISFSSYIQAFQKVTVLRMNELWMLIPVMKLVLLERIAERGRRLLENPSGSQDVQVLTQSLQQIKQTSWKEQIEPLILFDQILRQDPAGAYSQMDYETREQYRWSLVQIADRCDCSEVRVANEVVALAKEVPQQANDDPRLTLRHSHVGSYLVAEGRGLLEQKVGYHAPFNQRARSFLLAHPDEFYLPGIAAFTFAIVTAVVLLLTPPSTSLSMVLLSILAVLIPASQSAVQVMNYLATLFIPAKTLPKLDYSEGIPADCITLVAIPTMLMNEKQVRHLVEALEVRYLGNQDRNLHYALLSDLPDSPSEAREDQQPLVDLASELIRQLNEKYSALESGSFFLFHRHRIYNPRERIWMGWERKRGKLMDLNNLLRAQFDSFPVKVGNLAVLSTIRFVITLDSDTELPRGSAARMVGTLAHPLNQAIVDPLKGIVVAGYGILQPRVGVSVQSSARSRLAGIYSGQTGFDIYTHATSDVYQDLYGEGIFVGKGIYEVETLQRVLHRRFPRNALLSHDLMEGAYARAGLVSDIEVIEDYPSHYSAHNRRKHRWLRGDWQIAGWLLPRVPEESGERVPNPLSVISRWKILDNLRRSLVEPAIFLLFVMGWLALPGSATAWTAATVIILFLPAIIQLSFDIGQAIAAGRKSIVRDAFDGFFNASIANLLTITFLAHQALLSLDAVVRTMVRRFITRQRLLQWETAAEAELAGDKRTTLDIYLNWTPVLALILFAFIFMTRRGAALAALPVLFLWAVSKPVSLWLNRPPQAERKQITAKDRAFLRTSALRTWRYFAAFSTEEQHWLIPDNVREEDQQIAARISTTNLGLLLNARQAGHQCGYITLKEFCQQTLRTLDTVRQLPRHQGHLLNWYDTRTLKPLTPSVVSSVDNGNLVASLWSLEEGALDLQRRPIFSTELAAGLADHISILTELGALEKRKAAALIKSLRQPNWLQILLSSSEEIIRTLESSPASPVGSDAAWFRTQAIERIKSLVQDVQTFAPWMLPKFAPLAAPMVPLKKQSDSSTPLLQLPDFIDEMISKSTSGADVANAEQNAIAQDLLPLLHDARTAAASLIQDLDAIAHQSSKLVDEMDFGILINRNRKLLSVAYELDKGKNHPACYDLLASEARIAYFVGIAKGDLEQESWFLLGRPLHEEQGIVGLLSWTGTMFEYLMPALWMRLYPNTLLERAAQVAVLTQMGYATDRGVPWGISESASIKRDDSGNYHYFAFGVPDLAISKTVQEGPVISPYSTFLALDIDPDSALKNLRAMQRKNYLGSYGFYESLDFSAANRQGRSRGPDVVKCWMAHHQGMSLLAVTNFLYKNVMQDWFHSHPRVQATELLLQEKPAARVA